MAMIATWLDRQGWLLSFDVASDPRRNRLVRSLQPHAHRVLYSAFAAPPMPDADIAALIERCWAELDPATDSLIGLPWCPNCRLGLVGLRVSDGDELVVL
jgi:CRISPR/Cas system-associated endoribonuclease Cas2